MKGQISLQASPQNFQTPYVATEVRKSKFNASGSQKTIITSSFFLMILRRVLQALHRSVL